MSIADQITRLQTAKQNIKTATANKGVNIPNDKLISDYDDYIDQIQTGTNLVVNSNNLDYFCADRADFIPVLDDTEVLTYFEYGGTTYNFDIDMQSCFMDCTIFRYDPIKLVNKIINLNNKYANINMQNAFFRSVFNYDFGQDTTIYIKSAPNTQTIDLSYMFNSTDITNFKDIEIDFTDVNNVYTASLNIYGMLTKSKSGNNGFKITNLPVSLLSDTYNDLAPGVNTNANIKKLTSDGSELHSNLTMSNLKLTKTVFMEFINSLAANTSGNTVTIRIKSTLYNELTSDDLAAVTAKNYTLSR